MKVLHLCTFRSGGAGTAARRIHEAVLTSGVESDIVYRDDIPGIISGWRRRALQPWSRVLRKGMDLWVDAFKHPGCYGHSENLFPFASALAVNASDADLIHLHWINGDFLSIGALGKIRKPVVWTLHDNWAYCGNEFYTENCRYRTGYTASTRPENENGPDFSRFIWRYKIRKWKNFHPAFVSPSQWNADRLTESLLFRDVSCRVIRNPLDLECFSTEGNSSGKQKFRLDTGKWTLLFGAARLTNPIKGIDLLEEALKILPQWIPSDRLQLLCFGAGKLEIDSPYEIIHAGSLNGDRAMADLYRAADVLVCPSRMDNYPGVCTEAMACGVPAVAFRNAGLPEIISDPDSLAEPFQPESLAKAIVHAFENRESLARQARLYAEKNCDPVVIGKQYRDVYDQVLQTSRESDRIPE